MPGSAGGSQACHQQRRKTSGVVIVASLRDQPATIVDHSDVAVILRPVDATKCLQGTPISCAPYGTSGKPIMSCRTGTFALNATLHLPHRRRLVTPSGHSQVVIIARQERGILSYYNDTARQAAQAGLDRLRANGTGEYYSEGDTRAPTWLITGDTGRTVKLVGLDGRAADGGTADPDVAARWLDDGIGPNGAAGRGFTNGSVHGFDLTFAATKSVSLLRALTDDIADKAMQAAHQRAITAAMTYLHQHAG